MIETRQIAEKIILAGLQTSGTDPALFEEDMHEMQLLCETAGASVVAIITQKRERPESSTYLGRGKIEEIRAVMPMMPKR